MLVLLIVLLLLFVFGGARIGRNTECGYLGGGGIGLGTVLLIVLLLWLLGIVHIPR